MGANVKAGIDSFRSSWAPSWPFCENVRSWWAIRDLPNLKLIHFNRLKSDLSGSIREIAHFLGNEIDETKFPTIVDHCTFEYMKAHALQAVLMARSFVIGTPRNAPSTMLWATTR